MAGLMVNDLERKNDTIYRTRGWQERKTRDGEKKKKDEKRTLMSHVLVTNRVDVCTLGHDIQWDAMFPHTFPFPVA